MSKQQKIIHTVLLCSSLYTVNLFALPADEQDLSTTSVTQTAVRQFMETASTVNQLIGQHTPTYCTDKLTAKGAALTAVISFARVFHGLLLSECTATGYSPFTCLTLSPKSKKPSVFPPNQNTARASVSTYLYTKLLAKHALSIAYTSSD